MNLPPWTALLLLVFFAFENPSTELCRRYRTGLLKEKIRNNNDSDSTFGERDRHSSRYSQHHAHYWYRFRLLKGDATDNGRFAGSGGEQDGESFNHVRNGQMSGASVMIDDLPTDTCMLKSRLGCNKLVCGSAGVFAQYFEKGHVSKSTKSNSTRFEAVLTDLADFMLDYIITALMICVLTSTMTTVYDEKNFKGSWCHLSWKSELTRQSRKGWRFIFEFGQSWNVTLTAYPFTLNQLVQEIVQDNREPGELMRYEWQRYLSFQPFPQESPATPMRLAQAGFYYTGQGQEVRCFSCNAQNSTWSAEETPLQVHRRISPNCSFIRGESTDNVTIHGQDYYANMDQ